MCDKYTLRGIFSGHDVTDLVAFNPFTALPCFTGGCHSVTRREEGANRQTYLQIHTRPAHHSILTHIPGKKQCDATAHSIVESPSLPLSCSRSPPPSHKPPSLCPDPLIAGPRSFLLVVIETANKAITFTNFLRDRCWHNDCFLAG